MPTLPRRRSMRPFDAVESAGKIPSLSPRQLESARLIAEGMPRDDVANRMGIAPNTLILHLEEVRRRLGVESDVQIALVIFAADGPPPKNPEAAAMLAKLAPRQAEVVRLLVDGLRDEKIAEELGIKRSTLGVTLSNVEVKLKTQTWVDVVRMVLGEARDGPD